MTTPNLLAQADQAFSDGQSSLGLDLLRSYNNSNKHDAASWHRQATIEEQIGDPSAAGKAHFRCIEIAPNNAIGYLYGGYWLQQKGLSQQAAALYSIAHDLDASALSLWRHANVSQPTQQRSKEANSLVRQLLSDHHRTVCASLENSGRVKNAHWVQTSDRQPSYGVEDFAPELFFIPELSMKPFHDEGLDWVTQLNNNSHKIKGELSQALLRQLGQDSMRPYLDQQFSSH